MSRFCHASVTLLSRLRHVLNSTHSTPQHTQGHRTMHRLKLHFHGVSFSSIRKQHSHVSLTSCPASVILLSRVGHASVTLRSRLHLDHSSSRHKEPAKNVSSSLLPNKMTLLKFLFFPTKRTPALEMPIPSLQFLTINSTQAVVHKYFLSDSNLSQRTKNRTHR